MSEEHAGFVDIHCHILPGVDDGARDVTEAVRMAQLAVGSGIRIIVTTPHHLPRSSLSAVEEAKRRVANLQRHVDDAHLDLTLHPGQENAARSDLTQRLAQQEAVSLNGSRYLLVEPPFRSYPAHVDELLSALLGQGVTPVLAHPERNTEVQRDPDRVARLIARGIVIQVNTGSFLGHYGEAARETVSILLRRNMVHVIATDAHHGPGGRRVPNMRKGFEAVAGEMGEERAWSLARHNPLAITEGREVPDTWEVLDEPVMPVSPTVGTVQGRQERLI